MADAVEDECLEYDSANLPAPSGPAGAVSLLQELDARQDQLLDELEKLNGRIEKVIAEWGAWRGEAEEQVAVAKAA